MDNKLFCNLLLAGTLVLGATTVRAQMTLDFSDVETTTQQLSNGATLMEFPLDVDLSTVMAGVSVSVDGVEVPNEDIVPNPAELTLEDDQVVVLNCGGKAYQFHFSVGRYFTAIILSDPHIEHSGHDATTVANMRAYVDAMVAMGQGGTRFQFDAFPELIPTCDIALSLGDMDADSKTDSGQFTYAHSGFNAAGIPFITLLGNHDVVPDYWTGTDPDKGLTLGSSGGSTCNDVAIATVEAEADTAQLNGIEDYQIITDGTSHTQVNPFTFTFRGVRFYCGQTYWFQKPYEKPTILTYLAGTTTYYAPDGVIDSLEAFVEEHADEPSVWLQHYPFVAGSDCNRWWLDQNDYGLYIQTTDTSEYGTSDEVDIYTASSAIAVATKKKDKLASIINKTTNPVHFSGHTHVYATNTYQGITDYTVAATGYEAGAAYIALMKGGKGVLEVRKAYFNSALNASRDDIEQAILDASSADNRTAALLERLPQSLTQLNATVQDSLLTTATESGSVADMNSAFAAYRAQSLPTETIDVTALIGDNTGFEEAQGELVSPFAHVYPQTGWNEHYSYFSTEGNVAYYYAQQSSEVDTGSDGEACLYLRSRWQDQTCREQVMRQTALPAGDYTLTFSMKAAGTMTDNLCYVQVGTEQTAYSPTTAWVQYTQDIALEEPTLLTLSFGFTGGQGSTETALYVDDITLTTPGTYVEAAEDVSITITEGGYASLYYSDRDLAVADGLTALILPSEDNVALGNEDETGTLTLTEISDGVIPAATAVVLKGEAGEYTLTASTPTAEAVTSLLSGSDEGLTISEADEDNYYYVLGYDTNQEYMGFFYSYAGGHQLSVGAHKAYLKLAASEGSSMVRGFRLTTTGDEPTAISCIACDEAATRQGTYTLMGIRVQDNATQLPAGLYIINGKKVLVR